MSCTQRFSYTRCIERYTNLYMLSLILIFAPLVSCCSSPAKRPQLHEAALLHSRVRFTRSNLFLKLNRVLSEVNLTPAAGLQQCEPDPPFPEDPFTVPEFEAAKYHQPRPGPEHLLTRPSTNLGWSYGGNVLSWSSSSLLPTWEDKDPPKSATGLSSPLPDVVAHLPLLL